MKKNIIVFVVIILFLGLSFNYADLLADSVSEIALADKAIDLNKARIICDKIYASAESVNVEITDEEFLIPVMLVTAKQDFGVEISLPSDTTTMDVEYKVPLDFEFKNYQIGIIQFVRWINKEQHDECERQLPEEFKIYLHNNVKFYYGSQYKQEKSSLLVNLLYFPDDNSALFITFYVQNETELADELLEVIREDFTYISLKELKDLIR